MNFLLKLLQNIDNLVTYIFSNNAKENKFLIDFFKDKKITCFDVGANLGGYSDLIINNLNYKTINMFEPSKECVKFLSQKYNDKKISIINKAISNKEKKSLFYENEILSQSSLYLNKNKFNKNYNFKKKYTINCVSIDEYCKNKNKSFYIDLLKIDAEGEDLNVLKGSKKMLSQKRVELIKIELLNNENNKNKKSNIAQIFNYLDDYDYRLITVVKSKFQNKKLLMMDAYFSYKL